MAMNSSEALAASTKIIKTESQSVMEKKLSQDPINLIGKFQDDLGLGNFRNTARFLRFTCQNDLTKRQEAKKVREELLPHVFDANPEAVNLFFTNPDANPTLLLTKTCFREGYQSQELNKFVCFSEWWTVSPIQAAACSGDEFLLLELLARIVGVDEHRLEAQAQLKAVLMRISDQTIIMKAIDAIIGMESEDEAIKENAELRLLELQQSEEFQLKMKEFLNEMEELRRQMTDQAKVQEPAGKTHDTTSTTSIPSDCETKEERKGIAENAPIKYAEEVEFLAPVLRLLKAYLYYIIQCPKLASQNNWTEIDKNFELVGECHKRLPHYFKQEIFDAKPFSLNPPPAFATPPMRRPCRDLDNELLNLDGLGFGTFCGLYKGTDGSVRVRRACHAGRAPREVAVAAHWTLIVLASMAHLYKLRLTGLRKIIQHLETPDEAYALVKAATGPGKKN